jgi:hypothetical protein
MTKIQVDSPTETSYSTLEPATVQSPIQEAQTVSRTLHEIFSDETEKRSEQAGNSDEVATQNSTFWEKIYSWWANYGSSAEAAPSSLDSGHLPPPPRMEPISSIPELEEPIALPKDNLFAPVISKHSGRELLSEDYILEGLSHMSSFTLETIMLILYKAQSEIDRNAAENVQSSFERFHQFKKLQQETLIEIKEALAKDENTAKYFRNLHHLNLAANFIFGVACAASSVGLLAAAPAALTGIGITVAISTAISGASSTLFNYRENQSKASFEEWNHKEKFCASGYESVRQRIQEIMEGDGVFKEKFAEFLRRLNKIRHYVIART